MGTIREIPVRLTGKDQICFFHIPKTAGTSLFESIYERMGMKAEDHISEVLDYDKEELETRNFVAAHGQFRHHNARTSRRPVLITMLREPLARATSFYNFVQENPTSPQYPFAHGKSFKEFVELEGDHQRDIANLATRLLSDTYDYKAQPDIELALDRLKNQFAFVGLTERFEESLDLLSYTFNWPPFLEIKSSNKTEKEVSISTDQAEALEILNSKNDLDNRLYAEAKSIFESNYNKMALDITKKYFQAAKTNLFQSCQSVEEIANSLHEADLDCPLILSSKDIKKFFELSEAKQEECNRLQALVALQEKRLKSLDKTSGMITTFLASRWPKLCARIERRLRAKETKKNGQLMHQSNYFDPDWYLETYPDVAASPNDPATHYLIFGAVEGRDPSPRFSTRAYSEQYLDVAVSGINPLIHFLTVGINEGRSAYPKVYNNDRSFSTTKNQESHTSTGELANLI